MLLYVKQTQDGEIDIILALDVIEFLLLTQESDNIEQANAEVKMLAELLKERFHGPIIIEQIIDGKPVRKEI